MRDRRSGRRRAARPKINEKIYKKIYIGIAAMTALLNVLAWGSTPFCDAYIAWVFPVWINTYGRFMGIFPFSVGEWLLVAGLLLAALTLILGLVKGCMRLFGKPFGSGWLRQYFVFCAWVLLMVCLIMTLNCSMLYHASSFPEKYPGGGASGVSAEYSVEEFMRVRNLVAAQCNRLSGEVARDERGYILYPGSVLKEGGALDGSAAPTRSMQEKAREEMRRLGADYGQLDGYYPLPKPMVFSDFMCQQNMLGWYFPFSLEANYNRAAYVMNLPASMCHELAHLKGFIYEDEANFIGYLACVQSDDIYFAYSGYLSVLGYLEQDMRSAAKQSPEAFAAACAAQEPVALLDAVYRDAVFVTDEEWERIEGKALLDTETVDAATKTFLDATLKANGVSEGTVSYSHVVELLLWYYGG